MEHATGTRITLEVVEVKHHTCEGCFFEKACEYWSDYFLDCECNNRSDHKNVIYKEVKED